MEDLDQDRDVDAVIAECGGPARVWLNQNPSKNQNLRIRLVGKAPNHHAIGALVSVTGGPFQQKQWVRTGHAYLSQHELTLTFGIGTAGAGEVSVQWPDGTQSEHPELVPGKTHILTQP